MELPAGAQALDWIGIRVEVLARRVAREPVRDHCVEQSALVAEEPVDRGRLHAGAHGTPEPMARFMLGFYQAAREGRFAGVDPLLGDLLGRQPRSVRDLLGRQPRTVRDLLAE